MTSAQGRELDELLVSLDTAGVEILEEPKTREEAEEGEEFAELELVPETGEKTNDPVRMYLREMGTVPLLTREGEIELAKRMERGQRAVRKALSRSPLVIREVLQLGEDLARDAVCVRDVLLLPDLLVNDDNADQQKQEILAAIEEIGKHYRKAQQFRQKMMAISRGHETEAVSEPALRPGSHHYQDFAPSARDSVRDAGPAQADRQRPPRRGRVQAARA